MEPEEPGELWQPVEALEPVEPLKPEEPVKPLEPEEPVEPGKPGDLSKPEETTENQRKPCRAPLIIPLLSLCNHYCHFRTGYMCHLPN